MSAILLVRFLACSALGLGLLHASAALAGDATIGDVKLSLPAPAGFCELTQDNTADAAMLNFISRGLAGRNILLAMYAECGQLKEWEAGKRPLLDDFIQVQTLASMANQTIPMPPEDAEKQLCQEIKANGDATLKGLAGELDDRMAKVSKDIKINETRLIGVIGEDPRTCYVGMLERVKTEIGTEKTIVAAFGMGLIKGKIIYHYVFGPDNGPGTVEKLLTAERKAIAAVLAANP